MTSHDALPWMTHPVHAPSGARGPVANRILASLARSDLRMLEPMECVRLPARRTLFEAGSVLRHLYFPTSGLISLVHLDDGSAMPEIAQFGAEGVLGISALLGAERARHHALVQIAGEAYRVPVSSARAAFAQSRAFQAVALRFAEALMLELAQNAVCKLRHNVEQQFCRQLLLYTDRAREAVVELTHEQIAEALGSRRQGITEAARKLQTRQVIAYSRGRIRVLDRAALEHCACACYRAVRNAQAHDLALSS